MKRGAEGFKKPGQVTVTKINIQQKRIDINFFIFGLGQVTVTKK